MAQEIDAHNGITTTFSAMKTQLFIKATKANDAVEFYKAAFGAEEINRVTRPKRKADQELPLVISAELKIGDSIFVVSDDSSATFNSDTGGCYLCLETEDIDAAVAKAVKAGGVRNGEKVEVDGACFGGRVEKLEDPYGNFWILCSPAANADVEA